MCLRRPSFNALCSAVCHRSIVSGRNTLRQSIDGVRNKKYKKKARRMQSEFAKAEVTNLSIFCQGHISILATRKRCELLHYLGVGHGVPIGAWSTLYDAEESDGEMKTNTSRGKRKTHKSRGRHSHSNNDCAFKAVKHGVFFFFPRQTSPLSGFIYRAQAWTSSFRSNIVTGS